ncbi:aldehyde dehydrogenase family protein [Vogesella oryzae]|uniref:aldehyde dehydrogenase family protein n=1 Tax=Vogesella oryzae TaxID=1735285 RepID=UPI0015840EE0|nr:aldehyde dehydrogenase family protein [Vogesella oryzae]
MSSFRLTYSTMFNPPDELHQAFEAALARAQAQLGQRHGLFIDGEEVFCQAQFASRSPIDSEQVLGHFQLAGSEEVDAAMQAAQAAYPGWRRTPWPQRVALLRKVADLVEQRVYDIAAVVALEVGKNRMEALGEVQEVADFFRCYADDFERNNGFDHTLPDDPVAGYRSHNRSVLKPYGVWGVVAPFNFPFALTGGPVAAALVTGNTVVMKAPSDTPYAVRLLSDCLRDAGLPRGVFNFITGSGSVAGKALIEHPLLAGITFTGSYHTGMAIYRHFAAGAYPRPAVLEMGGKNAAIVTRHADLDRAALGIMRSAFGLSGQKCSALSRVYVEESVADTLIDKLLSHICQLKVGNPLQAGVYMGPVATPAAAANYELYCAQLHASAKVLCGGQRLLDGEMENGLFCAPTLAEAPVDHPLFSQEMFLPILMLARVADKEAALAEANRVELGLTAGMYGSEEEVAWFLDNIEAGVTYSNRPQGATTGAWPGYQPFGGWKGSGSTGKAIASFYYLPLYMREQSQTVVE